MEYYKKFKIVLFALIVPSLVTGPFLPNLLLCFLSILCIFEILKEKKFYYFFNKFFICFILWCLYLIFISLLSKTPANSLESSLFYFRFGIFVVVTCYLLNSFNKTIYYFFFISFIFILFIFLDSIYQYYNSYNFFNIYNYYQTQEMRLSGLFGKELILGSFFTRLYPLMVFLIFFLFEKNKRVLVSFFVLITLTTAIISVISGERAALLYFILSGLMITLTYLKKNVLLIMSSFSIIFFLILTIILTNTNIKNRIVDKTLSDFKSSNIDNLNLIPQSHSHYYEAALEMFFDNIFLGIGSKNYRIECKSEKYITFNACSTHPHQTYFQLLAETGFIGTIPVFLVFIYFLYIYSKGIVMIYYYKNDEKIIKLKNILSICFIISLLPIIPTGNFFSSWLSVIYFLPLGFYFFLINYLNNNAK